jgi:plasmid stabilization system protein ParE
MMLLSPDAAEDIERLRTLLGRNNPKAAKRALAAIWATLERVPEFPELGIPTKDADIRQIVVPFDAYGDIVR